MYNFCVEFKEPDAWMYPTRMLRVEVNRFIKNLIMEVSFTVAKEIVHDSSFIEFSKILFRSSLKLTKTCFVKIQFAAMLMYK